MSSHILIILLFTCFYANGQVKSDISADVDDSAIRDSSQVFQDYQEAKKIYDTVNGKNFTEDELRNAGMNLLERNDSIIYNRKDIIHSNGNKTLNDSLTNYSGKADEKIDQLLESDRAVRLRQKADSLDENLTKYEHLDKRQQVDSLSKLPSNQKTKKVKEIANYKKKAEKYERIRYMKSDELLSSSNIKDWPIEKEYDASHLSSYYEQYSDSVEQKNGELIRQLQPPVVNAEVLKDLGKEQLDSIREASVEKTKVKIKQSKVGKKIDRLNIKEKKSFFDKPDYSELIVGFDQTNSDRLTLTPSIAYELTKDLFFGVGLEVAMDFKAMENSILGYKAVMRYNPEPSVLYFQIENISYFSKISYLSKETGAMKSSYEQALNLGIGSEYALGRHISINSAVLYKLIKTENSRDSSPIIIRLGFTFK